MAGVAHGNADEIADRLALAARAGGAAILAACKAGVQTILKPDGSPVTSADIASQAAILDELARLFPGVQVVAEETPVPSEPPGAFILVDPLDGTRDFVAGREEYCVNVAFVADGQPVAGAIFAPAPGDLWLGGDTARHVAPDGSVRTMAVRRAPADGLVGLLSRSHGDVRSDAFLSGLPIRERRRSGSAIKFARIAEGSADVYVRFGRTLEWDTAAGLKLVEAAGGTMTTLAGARPDFGRADRAFVNEDFVVFGDPEAAAALLASGVSALPASG